MWILSVKVDLQLRRSKLWGVQGEVQDVEGEYENVCGAGQLYLELGVD